MLKPPSSAAKRSKTPQGENERQLAEARRKAQQKVLSAQMAVALKIKSAKDIADELGVTPQAVNGWKAEGKIATEFLLPLAKSIGCRVDDLLTAGAPLHAPNVNATFEGPAPTIEQAVEVLVGLLSAITPVEREVAKGALIALSMSPTEAANIATDTMRRLAEAARPPDTPKPKKKKATNTAAAERKEGRAALSVVAGGGRRSQLALPLNRAVSPSRNPFDESNASPEERRHYARWTAPKTKG
jgi:DNA-binding Xre family transcriptional regulator